MPSLTDTILKVIVDSTGVKSGVNAAIQDFNRLESAARSAASKIDNELKKLNRSGGGPKTGTSGFLNQTKEPPRPPGSVFGPPGFRRDFFEGREALVRQSLQTQRTFEEIGRVNKIYQKAVSATTTELNSAASNERALNIQRGKLQQAIQAEQFRLSSLSNTFNNSKSIRFGADEEESASFLNNLKPRTPAPGSIPDLQRGLEFEKAQKALNEEIAERRHLTSILRRFGERGELAARGIDDLRAAVRDFNQSLYGVSSSLSGQKVAEIQNEFNKALRVQAGLANQKQTEIQEANDRRVRVEKGLANQKEQERQQSINDYQRDRATEKSLNDQKKSEIDQRSRVISSLANQRLKAIEDPANLRALNRAERASGQTLTRPLRAPLLERVETGLRETGDKALSKTFTATTSVFRRAGSFVAQEFTNFVSRVAANLTSRLISSIVEGIGTISAAAVDAAKRYEDALVSFGVLAGSERRGTELVGELQKFAIDTPFKLQEVLDESKLLLSYGVSVDDLTKRLRQLGDVASGTGVDLGRLSLAYGQVLAKGRLQGPEIRQFTEAGVGVRDFVDAFNDRPGRTGPKVSSAGFLALVEQGEVTAKTVERAFDRMTGSGGRFFNFMEVRSKTVSGRLNALFESLELVTQKVGKSLFDRLGVGQGIDVLVKRLQGINFAEIDKFITEAAPGVQTFVAQVFGGLEAVIKGVGKAIFGSVTPSTFGESLKVIAEDVIPAIISAGKFLVDIFGAVAQAGIRFAQVIESIYQSLPDSGQTGTNLTAVGAAGIAGIALTASGVGAPIGLPIIAAVGIGTRATGANVFGTRDRDGGEKGLELLAANLSEARKKLDAFNPRDLYEKAIKERAKFQLDQQESAQKAARRKTAAEINASIAAENKKLFPDGVPLNANVQRRLNRDINFINSQAAVTRKQIIGRGADKFDLLAIEQVEDNRKRLIKEITDKVKFIGFSPITEKDVGQFAEFGAKVGTVLKELSNKFREASDQAIPGFSKRLEEMLGGLSKIGVDPNKDFENDIASIRRAASPLANLLGFEGAITKSEEAKLVGQRTLDFIAKFKPDELRPAPLIRQASQEAEQALTRAIYDSQNNEKSIQQQLIEAQRKAASELEKNTEQLKKANEAAAGIGVDPLDMEFFGAVDFGP